MAGLVFWLDRDGTIVDDPGYLDDPAKLVLLPGAATAVARLNALGTVVLVTNQSGVGRGYMSAETVQAIHARLRQELADSGARLDRVEICPHTPDEGCDCRKPEPEMILRARRELPSASGEYVVGDKIADLKLARATGCIAILVRTGDGRDTEAGFGGLPNPVCDHVADDLGAAVDWIESREREAGSS